MESSSKPLYGRIATQTVVKEKPGHMDGIGTEYEKKIMEIAYPTDDCYKV
jgi:hypothetical protein